MSQLHIPIPVPPNHLPSMNEVPKIEVLEPIMANGLALSLSADFGEERVREEAISPTKLVTVNVEGDGGTGGEGTWNQVGTCQEHCKDWTILPEMFPAGTFHIHSKWNATMHLDHSHQEHLIHICNVILTCS